MSKIPLSVPSLKGNELRYVKECIDTEWVSSAGKYVDLFEDRIAKYTHSKYAIACVSGSAALQVSLRLSGVCAGDEVIVSTLTFIATVNAIAYNNASPVFMDVDQYYNIDQQKVIQFIKNDTIFKNGFTFNKKTNKRIRAIIPVHVWGNACQLDMLVNLCDEKNILIIEDACEGLGTFYNSGKYENKHVGTLGKLGCLSFNGNKIITTGGGGMILTDDEALAEKAKYLTTQAKDNSVRYVHNEIGYNFRLTNIQAALGVAQLEQLPKILKKKKEISAFYQSKIKNIEGLSFAEVPSYSDNNQWLNLLQIQDNLYSHSRDSLMDKLEKKGIQTRPVWKLNHTQRPYKNSQHYKIKNAPSLVEKSLCLPSSSNLKFTELDKIINQLIG